MNEYLTHTDNFMASLELDTYRVGGSVRDELLGRRVKDADYMVRGESLATLGAELAYAARKVDPKSATKPLKLRDGRQAGWRVSVRGCGVMEIMLPRTDVSIGPGHRDFKIVIDPDLGIAEDAKRRDFTFNALYKHLASGEVADPTGCGLYDLSHRMIRTTYEHSFRDDPLRTLRALRFASVLGYDLATVTLEQMTQHADAVTGLAASGNVSGTVYDEMCKLLMGDDVARALRIAAKTGVLGVLFPELAPMVGFDQGSRYHDMTTDEHTFTAVATAAKVDAPLRVRWALLFHDSGKPATAWVGNDGRKHYYARKEDNPTENGYIDPFDGHITMDHEEYGEILWREAAERMNVPRAMREDVATLVRNHMVSSSSPKRSKVVRDRIRFGDEMLRDLHMHRMCDLSGKGSKNRNMLMALAAREDMRRRAEGQNVPASTKDLAVNGRDAKDMGLDGPAIGKALAAVLDEVIVDPTEQKLSREWQMARLEALA